MPLVAVILDDQSAESLSTAQSDSIKQICLLKEITGLDVTPDLKLEWRENGTRCWLKVG
jgi:hypothetical protein